MNNQPVYPKDNGSLERARLAFYEKVKNWRWEDPEEKKPTAKKGRKRKPSPREQAAEAIKNNNLKLKNK